MWLSLDVLLMQASELHRMPAARSFVTESQQLCAHILGLLQVTFAGWQLLHQTAPLGPPQRVVGLHTDMPLCCLAVRQPAGRCPAVEHLAKCRKNPTIATCILHASDTPVRQELHHAHFKHCQSVAHASQTAMRARHAAKQCHEPALQVILQ